MREIEFSTEDYTGSNALYAIAYRTGDTQYVNGSNLERYDASHWADYAIALTLDEPNGVYYADFPSVANDVYFVRIFEQLGDSPSVADATADPLAQGEFSWIGTPPTSLFEQTDANAFIAEFSEPLIYNVFEGASLNIRGVVSRRQPGKVEDGHSITDYLDVSIANDATLGVTSINVKRDTITVSGRYGGAATEHLVAAVIDSDAGIWRLECR